MIVNDLFGPRKNLAEDIHDDDYEDCSHCSGTGEGRYEGQSCSHCGGSGVEPSSNDDDVDITDDDWYDDSEEPESYYEKSLRSRGLGEGTADIDDTIRALYQHIYDQGDDALEYLNTHAPLFSQFWDQYEGDLDSIIAELSPKNLIRIAQELKQVAGQQGVAEGSDERKQNALWAQITAHEKAAKKSKDLKQQHHLKMADQLRSQLKTSDLNEFAPGNGDDREPNEEEILRRLAAQWWSGSEQQMAKAQRTLETLGWEIGPDESGDDDAGVYVYRIGDDDGRDTIAFGHSELSLDEGVAEGEKSPMFKDAQKADRIRSLKNLIAIAREQGRQLRVQELELELKKLQGVVGTRR